MTTQAIHTISVRIHEPAVEGGLFPRPRRYLYTNMHQFEPSQEGVSVLPLRYCGATWHFVDGKCQVYDSVTGDYVLAEIVGEIDASRSMEPDRFVDIEN